MRRDEDVVVAEVVRKDDPSIVVARAGVHIPLYADFVPPAGSRRTTDGDYKILLSKLPHEAARQVLTAAFGAQFNAMVRHGP